MKPYSQVRQSRDAVATTLRGLTIHVSLDSKLVRFCLFLAAWGTSHRTRRNENGKIGLQ